jgi:hypothetical protein
MGHKGACDVLTFSLGLKSHRGVSVLLADSTARHTEQTVPGALGLLRDRTVATTD